MLHPEQVANKGHFKFAVLYGIIDVEAPSFLDVSALFVHALFQFIIFSSHASCNHCLTAPLPLYSALILLVSLPILHRAPYTHAIY